MLGCAKRPNMGAGMPDYRNGKFIDSDYNKKQFERAYRDLVAAELSGNFPQRDWKLTWKACIEAVERSSENPQIVKKIIRKIRAEAGLPIWDYMWD